MPQRQIPTVMVTPEMIAAGVEELFKHPIVQPEEQAMKIAVERVYRAMETMRLKTDGSD